MPRVDEDAQGVPRGPREPLRATQFIEAGKCMGCKQLVSVNALNKNWLCRMCVEHPQNAWKNSKWYGETDGKPPFSFEFEVQYLYLSYGQKAEYDTQELVDIGFLQTIDSTVDDEWKSPIYREFTVFEEVLPVLDTFKKCVGYDSGTHIHIQADYQRQVHNKSTELFTELQEYMGSRQEETTEFWGRYFQSYCGQHIGGWINAGDIGQPTLEWRLAKYRDSEQFKTLLSFVRDQTQWIDYEMGQYERRSPEALARFSDKLVENYKKAVN